MEKIKGLEALKAITEGEILDFGERFYRLISSGPNEETIQIEYSDDKQTWKPSSISMNDFLKSNWNLVK